MAHDTSKQKTFPKIEKIKLYIQKWQLKKLIIWKYRLEKKLDRLKIVKIESLTPKILSSREDNHTALLNEVIQNNDIFNIALTGPYGSGKTSIIKTFEQNFGNLKFLNISLATFDGKVIKDDKTSKLEYNILKQIFYKVSHDKVPLSRFKRIVNYTNIPLRTCALFFWISSIIYLSDFNLPDSFITTKLLNILWQNKFNTQIFEIICSIYVICGGIYFLYKTYDFFINFKIGKLKVSEAEFDNKNDSKSIDFENEIDEILYFFEKNKTDVVFIEDLDRFDNTEIYIKLREINSLINNYEPIKRKGKVTFAYAVRDNMFDETERTKFFDIILPVIPVINYTNSSDKFIGALAFSLSQIQDLDEKSKFKDFVEIVSRYINDMRTIISICNEFKIYEKILGGSGIDKIKLLAMMVYKNIEPSDFDCLDKNKGYVYQLFKNKNNLINDEIEEIDKALKLIDEKIKESKKETFENIIELRRFYLYAFINLVNKTKNHYVIKIKIGDAFFDENELIKDSNFVKFIIQKNIQFVYNPSNDNLNTDSYISFKIVEDAVSKKMSYKDRSERLLNKERDELNKLKKEHQDFLSKRESIISQRLSEILITHDSNNYFITTFKECFTKPNSTLQIERLSDQSVIEFKDINSHKINNKNLIDFLVREGYIDENYERFISKYNGSHKENQTFLLSLSNRKSLKFDYKIKDVSSLIKNIKSDCFNQKEILNFYLIDYLLLNKKQNQLNSVFLILKDESENSVSFIDGYLDYANDSNKEIFLSELIKYWKNIYTYIALETSYLPEKYLRIIFKSLTVDQINEININDYLLYSISEMSDLKPISFTDNNKTKVEEFLKKNNVRFTNLVYNKDHKHLFDFIYDNNLYELNFNMIELFVNNKKTNDIDLNKLKTSNFTTILESGCEKMVDFINEHEEINNYVYDVFLDLKNNIDESEDSIVHLLNCEFLTPEIVNRIIEKSPTIISEVSKIKNKTLWSKLFEFDRLEVTWGNFFEYFREFEKIDKTLVNYLNVQRIFEILSQSDMEEVDEDSKLEFSDHIITSDINDNSFEALAKQFPYKYNLPELFETPESRVKVIINNDLIPFDKDNFDALNDQFPNQVLLFATRKKEDFLSLFKNLKLNASLIANLLKSNSFTNNEKVKIIENTTEEVLISKTLPKDLCVFLHDKEKIKITETLILELLSSSADASYRISLFNSYYTKNLSLNILNLRIKSLGDPYDLLLGRKHLKLDKTTFNSLFCKNLDQRYISKISEKEEIIIAIPKAVKI